MTRHSYQVGGHEQQAGLITQIFDSIPDEILVLNTEMVIQEANETFLRNNNLTIEQVKGRRCYDVRQVIRGECHVAVDECPFYNVIHEKAPASRVRKHFEGDGQVRYAAIVAAPLKNESGDIIGVIEMTRDITHRILLETELKATEGQLQKFMEMAPLATYVKNRQGQYIEVNPETSNLLNTSRGEILGKTDYEILPREKADIFCKGDREVLTTGKAVHIDTELDLASSRVFLSTVKYPLLDSNNNVHAVCGLSMDVTAQKQAEAELTRTRVHLQNILDNSPVIIITADLQGRVVSFNRGAQEALLYTADEVIGKPASMFYYRPDERNALFRRVQEAGSARDFETTAVRKDGSTLQVTVTLSQLRDSSGKMIGTVGISKDISHRKGLMRQIMQSDRQAAMGRMAAGVAHEINNPLAVIGEITGYLLDLVKGGPGSDTADLREELLDGLPKIEKHVKRGRTITHRLLSFARKTEAKINITDVNAALEEIIPFHQKEAQLANVQIHKHFQQNLPKVAIEELQLQEIFINILNNAIQALTSEKEGNIWLATTEKEGKILITIRDDGPGIAEEIRDRLFDPFVTTKPPGEGTGLGLSICYGIVKRYDGEILVNSKIGSGTTFTVVLPALK